MKKIVTFALALLALSAVAASAAGPYFARGGYYDAGWSTVSGPGGNELIEGPAGVFTAAVTSPMAAGYYEGKAANGDWSTYAPLNSNQPVFITGPGDVVNWTFDTNTYADGWSPASYFAMNDHGTTGLTFEVIGAAPETGSWGFGIAAVLGGDVWSVQIPIATPGTYDVKFRKTGDWSINVGSDGYGTNSLNYTYTTTVANEPMLFQFNQRSGRMRVVSAGATPTHSTTFGGLKAQYR